MLVTIPLRFSNAYLVKGQQPVLIDSGSPGDEARIIRALDAHRFSLRDLRLIIHTHAHMDHAGSTAALIQKAGIPALIHARDYDNLVAGKNGRILHRSFIGWLIKKFIVKEYDPVRADIIFQNKIDLSDFGIDGKLVHTPGHTPGSCSVLLSNGDALVGDLMMGGWIGGYIIPEQPGYHYFIDDVDALHRSMRKLLDMGAQRFFPGHGGPLERADVEKFLRKSFPIPTT